MNKHITPIKETSIPKPLSAYSPEELQNDKGEKVYAYLEIQSSIICVYKVSYPDKYRWCVEEPVDPDNYRITFYPYEEDAEHILRCHKAYQQANSWLQPYQADKDIQQRQAQGLDCSGNLAQLRSDLEEECISYNQRVNSISETLECYSKHSHKLKDWEKAQEEDRIDFEKNGDPLGIGRTFDPTSKEEELFMMAATLERVARDLRSLAYFNPPSI